MSLLLSGTDGLSDVDGTAATPAIRGTDTNTGIFFPAADTIAFSEGGVEAARFDASGNLGVGVTPSPWGSALKAIQIGSTNSVYSASVRTFALANNSYNNGSSSLYLSTGPASAYIQSDNNHLWYTAPSGTAGNAVSFTQAMTLDQSGNLLVGTASAGVTNTLSTTIETSGANNSRITVNHSSIAGSSNDSNYMQFGYAGNLIGRIVQATTSSVSYTTSSDYRLKEDIQPMTGALAKVAALKPVTYKWKVDGSAGQGFIAHELQAVVPDCVTGEKDAVETVDDLDAEGRKIGTKEVPRYQGVDTSFLVATLVAAIQELKSEFDAYKATHP